MQLVTITGAGNISYKILKDYHFTAHAIYDLRVQESKSYEEEKLFEIQIPAVDIDNAKEIFMAYLRKLRDLEVNHHFGHLTYITQNILNFEGSYITDEARFNDVLTEELELLIKLINIKEKGDYNLLNLELTTNAESNSDFKGYIKINNPDVIKASISAAIESQFEYIKSNTSLYPFNITEALKLIKAPTLDNISELLSSVIPISARTFRTQLLYTVCSTLLAYLTEWSHLNPEKVFMTNDQARVIYQTCKLHNLLQVSHEVERDELNYIRMAVKNNQHHETMRGKLTD